MFKISLSSAKPLTSMPDDLLLNDDTSSLKDAEKSTFV